MDIIRQPYPYHPRIRPVLRKRYQTQWTAFFVLTGTFSLVLLPFMLLAGIYLLHLTSGRLMPSLMVSGTNLGSLTRAEAERRLNAAWNQEKLLVASDGQRTWQLSPGDVGLSIDTHATVEQAYQIGRGPDGMNEVFALLTGRLPAIVPQISLDLAAAQAGLETLSPLVNLPARDATLRFENGQWVAVPSQNGLSLNIPATLQQLAGQPRAVLISGYLPLVTQAVAPQVSDAGPLLQRLQAALDLPLRIAAYDPISDEHIEWNVPRDVLAGWLTVEVRGQELNFALDGSQLPAFLEQQAATLGADRSLEPASIPAELASLWQAGDPINVLIHRQPTTYTVESGDTLTRIGFKVGMPYWKILAANPGIDMDHLSAGSQINIPSPNEMLPLPIVMNKRIVISISEQRMWTYENGQQRSEYVISTGISRSPTYPGVYQVQTHEVNAYASVWDLHMPHFMGIYEGWPGFMNGIHGLPTLSSGVTLWANVLGKPASFGCIILNLQDAEDLYNWAEEGVIVEIQN
jgi:lipoprotein-anchoring transpeptidase ErfK/SrfK